MKKQYDVPQFSQKELNKTAILESGSQTDLDPKTDVNIDVSDFLNK